MFTLINWHQLHMVYSQKLYGMCDHNLTVNQRACRRLGSGFAVSRSQTSLGSGNDASIARAGQGRGRAAWVWSQLPAGTRSDQTQLPWPAMAESGGGQQRSFTKNLSRQSAQQIRQSATATVKALSEQVGEITHSWFMQHPLRRFDNSIVTKL